MSGEYRLILADPSWPYFQFSDSIHGAVKSQYETMPVEDICKIPVGAQWAHKNSFLLLWATWPHLDSAIRVIQAWDFKYVTGIPWIKTTPSEGDIKTGIGFYFQSTSECLLLAKRGKPKRKSVKAVLGLLTGDRVFYAPRRKHSEKPYELYSWIEHSFDGPFLELFARRRWSEKWTAWGHDLGFNLNERGVEPWQPSLTPITVTT